MSPKVMENADGVRAQFAGYAYDSIMGPWKHSGRRNSIARFGRARYFGGTEPANQPIPLPGLSQCLVRPL